MKKEDEWNSTAPLNCGDVSPLGFLCFFFFLDSYGSSQGNKFHSICVCFCCGWRWYYQNRWSFGINISVTYPKIIIFSCTLHLLLKLFSNWNNIRPFRKQGFVSSTYKGCVKMQITVDKVTICIKFYSKNPLPGLFINFIYVSI